MKRICLSLLLIVVYSFSTIASAQRQCQHNNKLSREEFTCKQREYIIEQAKLSNEEAKSFFPLFRELHAKRQQINCSINCLMKKGRKEELSETQYDELMESIYDLKHTAEELERTYYHKFREVLPAKKIYKIYRAKMKFTREMFKRGVQEGDKD